MKISEIYGLGFKDAVVDEDFTIMIKYITKEVFICVYYCNNTSLLGSWSMTGNIKLNIENRQELDNLIKILS